LQREYLTKPRVCQRIKRKKTAEVMKQVLTDIQPIRRAGIVDDIARTAVFLAMVKIQEHASTFIDGH